MAKFTLYHSNKIDSAIFGGGSWTTNLPLSNLYSPTTTKRARTTDTQLASTQLTISIAESLLAFGIQIISTNLSPAAQYRISWYSDAAFTSQIGTTGWITVGSSIDWTNTAEWFDWLDPDFWLGSEPFIDPDNQGRDIRHTFATSTPLQYVLIEFDDTTNADGFIEAGYVFIGSVFVPSINIAPDPAFSRVSMTSMQESVGGAQFFNRRGSRKRLTVTWPVLPKEEVLDEIDQIIQIHDVDRPVYVDLDPDNVMSGRNTAFLARIEQLPEARMLQAYLESDTGAAIGFEFIQVL